MRYARYADNARAITAALHASGCANMGRMTDSLGEDVAGALAELVTTADSLPGAFRPEFSLTYWAGVTGGADGWSCTFEGDIHGDTGTQFFLTGQMLLTFCVERPMRRVIGSQAEAHNCRTGRSDRALCVRARVRDRSC
jgi:hypothetical protein